MKQNTCLINKMRVTAVLTAVAAVISGCSVTDVIPSNNMPQNQGQGQPNSVVIEAYESSETATTTSLYMATENLDFSNFVFIGDSRTVGLASCVDIETIAEVGVGYSFLQQHYNEIIELHDKNIVFNLGVNDLTHVDSYIEFFQRLPEDFTFDNHIYVVSVNPTSGPYAGMNQDIDYFNVQLADSLPSTCKWIDTCSFLREAGFGTSDGLHYDQTTYETIANLIYNNVMLYQQMGY